MVTLGGVRLLIYAVPMDDLLRQTLDLQPAWVAKNTPEMERRGVIVRKELAAKLRVHVSAMAAALGVPIEDLGVEGKDGTGLKTEIPWVRVYSKERSPSATTGWYVVYLFGASGDRVYLSLNQGTTTWTGADFAPRDPSELKARVDWARRLLGSRLDTRTSLIREIDLEARKSGLAKGYEAGNVVAIEYLRRAIPSSAALTDDLLFMCDLLADLYAGAEASYVPGDVAPEVLDASEAAGAAAGRRVVRGKRQGFRLTAEERRTVELHSVRLAIDYFTARGWSVTDVGAKESYDLLASRNDERLHIEVKGTTSLGSQVVLTRSEVERQRKLAPNNALVIVHSIELDRSANPATASGGTLVSQSPWMVDDSDLTVVSYVYRTGL